MPRIKKLSPRIVTYPFKVKIVYVLYPFDMHGIKFSKERTFKVFCLCKEVKYLENKEEENIFKAEIILRCEDYKNRVIRKNDILLLSDRIEWINKGRYVYCYYDTEKVIRYSPKKLERDKHNRAYFNDIVISYCARVGVNQWKLYEKYADEIKAHLGYDKDHIITLYFDTKEEMLEFEGGEFFVTEEEYETLKEANGKRVYLKPIISHIPIAGRWYDINFYVDEDLHKMIMNLKIKGENL